MSRAARIGRALTIGYGFQATVALTGLALTPLLLSRLGADDYGRWLIAGQVLALLALLDLGVTAVLPREVARAAGAGEPVAEVVRRARWLVWFQTPVVAAAAAGTWAAVSAARPELGGPLAAVLIGFAVQFPLRIPGAVLAGLQDLTFCAALAAAQWAVTTAVSVALVLSGWGLLALAVGWAAGQAVGCSAAWLRLRAKFPEAQGGWGWPGRPALVGLLGPSLWTSLRQVAQLLLNGVELIVLGWVAGPAAVVAYVCTTKVVALVANQPYLLASSALPALAELHAAGDRERLWRACRAVGWAVGLVSAGLALFVLALNPAFVPAWVGPAQYAGHTVTVLAVAAMIARHLVFATGVILGAMRYDALGAAIGLADGAVLVAATAGWVAVLGPVGVPLGSLTAVCLVSGPLVLYALRTEVGVTAGAVAGWLAPLAGRAGAVLVPVAAAGYAPCAGRPLAGAAVAAAGALAAAVFLFPLLRQDPLGGYRDALVAAVRRKLGLRAPVPAAEAHRSET